MVDKPTLDVSGFNRWCMENLLQRCPGATIGNDLRQSEGKPFYEYYVTLLPQSEVKHKVELPWLGRSIDIPVQKNVTTYPRDQKSYETENSVNVSSFGPRTRGPRG